MTITNDQLRDTFLTPAMLGYFKKKLPHLPAAEIGARIEETLKFLNIAIYCRGDIPVTREIDEVWHYWILETKEYWQLCQRLQGRKFVHHSSKDYPAASSDVFDEDADLVSNVATLGTYVLNYGPFEADRVKYWRLATLLVDKRGWTVERLNAWLGGLARSNSGKWPEPGRNLSASRAKRSPRDRSRQTRTAAQRGPLARHGNH